ncbi:methylated-DNA--[protein]-cysteine S-methyltransferase [Oceanobacillus sp. 143]|uniref:methylated-DNA--[protein]-cysteine S-methyltransferase n=1 Tax=Oceanobacillus zhaokaii TaxID=2052660 RepID=A0A345PJK7_9BACI|nr:methylated-DNA--[protein]-cysteine S-methyltransferase [Oceanobacillus zhaokaii]AXI10187.1 methylated-DNA--[protein]-cysteine S-methyltransferase [Oceanobacillus zhaokaii]QGS69287.1 methylated-DNA--[protein]-cysteine S-methyltransferase [Oceanobacillus sp. 143]
MKHSEEQTVYYGLINMDDWSIYLAVSQEGLCYVGSHGAGIEEMEAWFKKNRPKASLIDDSDKISIYADQLVDYLNGERKVFNLPVDLIGTPFQDAVWKSLQNIPFGEKLTYTDIAEQIGKPKSVRAVGSAIGANPVLIIVPCHRVISKGGKMAGYRGGIPMKKRLLGLESFYSHREISYQRKS